MPGQYGARFTTNPGLTAAMYVARRTAHLVAVVPGAATISRRGARVSLAVALVPPACPTTRSRSR